MQILIQWKRVSLFDAVLDKECYNKRFVLLEEMRLHCLVFPFSFVFFLKKEDWKESSTRFVRDSYALYIAILIHTATKGWTSEPVEGFRVYFFIGISSSYYLINHFSKSQLNWKKRKGSTIVLECTIGEIQNETSMNRRSSVCTIVCIPPL